MVVLLITGDLLFPSPLLRIEKMLPGLRLPNSLNPFLIFPLDWDSQGRGSMFSVCTSIFSPCPPFSVSSSHLQLLFPCQWSEHLYPDRISISVCSLALPLLLSVRFFNGCLYPSLCLSFPSSPFSSISPLKAPPLCLIFVWLLSLVAIATEELSSFRQQCRARGCHQPTLNTAFPSSLPLCLMTMFT